MVKAKFRLTIQTKGFIVDLIELLFNKGIACLGTLILTTGTFEGNFIMIYGGLILMVIGLGLSIEIKTRHVEEEQIYPKEESGIII